MEKRRKINYQIKSNNWAEFSFKGGTYIDKVTNVMDIVIIEIGVHGVQVDKIFIPGFCAFLTVFQVLFQPLEGQKCQNEKLFFTASYTP